MRNNFPLQWPVMLPRTDSPRHAQFDTGLSRAAENIVKQLSRMKATDVRITSNLRYKSDGIPYARQSFIEDAGVAVYFTLKGEEKCVAVDKWVRVADNMQAIAKIIEALRGLERWGSHDIIDAAFRGFAALPASIVTPPPKREWWIVLDFYGDHSSVTKEQIERRFKILAKAKHPDAGGSTAEFQELEQAKRDALDFLK